MYHVSDNLRDVWGRLLLSSGLPAPEGTDVNAALRKALAEAQLTETDVAAHLGVDPKTVRRWLSGQRPYPRHRWALAELLQVDEGRLWPDRDEPVKDRTRLSEHAQHVYAHRWQVAREIWSELFSEAEEEIGILAYSGLFLADDAGILNLLSERARAGVNVRILLGEPDSHSVKQRGRDEGIGEMSIARARNSMLLFQALIDAKGVIIRTHSTTLYNSIYITDCKILVNHHIYGLPAAKAPVSEISRELSPGIADIYVRSFEEAWVKGRNTLASEA